MPYDISVVKMTAMRMHHRAMYMSASRLLNVRSGVSTTACASSIARAMASGECVEFVWSSAGTHALKVSS